MLFEPEISLLARRSGDEGLWRRDGAPECASLAGDPLQSLIQVLIPSLLLSIGTVEASRVCSEVSQ